MNYTLLFKKYFIVFQKGKKIWKFKEILCSKIILISNSNIYNKVKNKNWINSNKCNNNNKKILMVLKKMMRIFINWMKVKKNIINNKITIIILMFPLMNSLVGIKSNNNIIMLNNKEFLIWKKNLLANWIKPMSFILILLHKIQNISKENFKIWMMDFDFYFTQ